VIAQQGNAVGSLFKKPQAPAAPEAPPDYAKAGEDARQKKLMDEEQKRLRGRASTLLTGGLGDTSTASVSKTLLS
jgi:hypothetical protein